MNQTEITAEPNVQLDPKGPRLLTLRHCVFTYILPSNSFHLGKLTGSLCELETRNPR